MTRPDQQMPPPKQASKDHHYVPQFYLKQWADTTGKVNSVRTGDKPGVIGRPNPRGILNEQHLNTAFTNSGHHIYGEEWIFKETLPVYTVEHIERPADN